MQRAELEELTLPGAIEATGIAVSCYIEDSPPELQDHAIVPLCGGAALQIPLTGFESVETLRGFFPVGFRFTVNEPMVSFSRGKRMLVVDSYEDVRFEEVSSELQSLGFQEFEELGNQEGNLQLARLYYSEALKRAETHEELVAAASNKAEVALKLHYPDEAILAADAALKCDPTHSKSLLHKAKGLSLAQEHKQALVCMELAISHATGTSEFEELTKFKSDLEVSCNCEDPANYDLGKLPPCRDFVGPVGRRSGKIYGVVALRDIEAGELLMVKNGVAIEHEGDDWDLNVENALRNRLATAVIRRTANNKRLAEQVVGRLQKTSFFGPDVSYYPKSETSALDRASVNAIVKTEARLYGGHVGIWPLANFVHCIPLNYNCKFSLVDRSLLVLRSIRKIKAGGVVYAAYEPSTKLAELELTKENEELLQKYKNDPKYIYMNELA